MKFNSTYLKKIFFSTNTNNIIKENLMKQIKENTKLCRNHLTPEIQLHLITRDCELWTARSEQSPFQDPFWAFYWPGGQALSRYILNNPKLISGKSVLDVGSGSGACAIAAAKCGAKLVTANDIDKVSCVAIEMNCKVNNVSSVEIDSNNLIGSPCDKWDCLLVGDMFYDSDFGLEMFSWLKKLSRFSNKLILVGDPGRHAFKETVVKSHLKLLLQYSLPLSTCMENNGFKTGAVWKFIRR